MWTYNLGTKITKAIGYLFLRRLYFPWQGNIKGYIEEYQVSDFKRGQRVKFVVFNNDINRYEETITYLDERLLDLVDYYDRSDMDKAISIQTPEDNYVIYRDRRLNWRPSDVLYPEDFMGF